MRHINSNEKSENPRTARENYIGFIVRLLNTFWITEYLEERQRVDLMRGCTTLMLYVCRLYENQTFF